MNKCHVFGCLAYALDAENFCAKHLTFTDYQAKPFSMPFGRPHGDSCFCTMCAMLFTGGTFNDQSLQRPQESPEEAEEAPAGQTQEDSPRPLRVKWVEDILKRGGLPQTPWGFPATIHPHTNCPQCQHEKKDPEPGDPELEALIAAMRTSAQETLTALHRHGWKIVKS